MSAQYAPVHGSDAEDERVGSRAPGFPQAEPYGYAGSSDTLVLEAGASPGAHGRASSGGSGNRGAHVRPTFVHQRTTSSGPHVDPWSPGYQRNTSRLSMASTHDLHAGRTAHHRLSTAGTLAGPPISKWQNFKNKFRGHYVQQRGHKIPGLWESLKALVTFSWMNVLFLVLPVAWYWCWRVAQPFAKAKSKSTYEQYVYLFFLAFVAIIPLENLAEFSGEQLALYCGESIGDLIVITLHNVVEVVLAWFLLIKCELKLLQATAVGVVLLHSLFVPGVAFLTGGSKVWAQNLKPRVTELNHSLLTIGVLSLVVPTGFYSALPYLAPVVYAPQFANATLESHASNSSTTARLVVRGAIDEDHKAAKHAMEVAAQVVAVSDSTRGMILSISRGISVILLVMYVGSRIYLHNPPGGKKRPSQLQLEEEGVLMHDIGHAITPGPSSANQYFDTKHRSTTPPHASTTNLMYRQETRHGDEVHAEHAHGHEHTPKIGPWPALIVLVITVGMLTITAECLVVAIKPIRERADEKKMITDEWFGLVLLPLLSYAGDGLNTTVYFLRSTLFSQDVPPPDNFAKSKNIDLAIQFTLFWIPVLVLVAWIIGKPLGLLFDHFEIVVIVGACFLVNSVTQDGQTNWAEGLIMVGFYVIIALAAWYYPGEADVHFMSYCFSIQKLLENPA